MKTDQYSTRNQKGTNKKRENGRNEMKKKGAWISTQTAQRLTRNTLAQEGKEERRMKNEEREASLHNPEGRGTQNKIHKGPIGKKKKANVHTQTRPKEGKTEKGSAR